MKGVNPIPANTQQNGGAGFETKPEFGPSTLNIKVSHGLTEHEVAVPSTSTFGDLKSILVQKIGLNPKTHKLLFRGKEKEDDEELQTAGVKDNSKLLFMEDTTIEQNIPVVETIVVSRGGEAVAQVREEVDKLAEKVLAVQAVVDSGTKVDNKNILYLTEMLMRQLLKLDGIVAEGEGKIQRKAEVRRVQSFVDTMDNIKSRNSNPSNNAASVTTQWETFEPSCGNVAAATSPAPPSSPVPTPTPFPASISSPTPTLLSAHVPTTPILTPTPVSPLASSPVPSSSTKVTEDWEHFE